MYEYYMVLSVASFCVISGLIVFVSFHKHLLITLLSLEYIMLNVYLVMVLSVGSMADESYLILAFLVFAVSEGSIGLSLLVSLVRSHGGDYLKMMNLVW